MRSRLYRQGVSLFSVFKNDLRSTGEAVRIFLASVFFVQKRNRARRQSVSAAGQPFGARRRNLQTTSIIPPICCMRCACKKRANCTAIPPFAKRRKACARPSVNFRTTENFLQIMPCGRTGNWYSAAIRARSASIMHSLRKRQRPILIRRCGRSW